jgi:hypothetical protein
VKNQGFGDFGLGKATGSRYGGTWDLPSNSHKHTHQDQHVKEQQVADVKVKKTASMKKVAFTMQN